MKLNAQVTWDINLYLKRLTFNDGLNIRFTKR